MKKMTIECGFNEVLLIERALDIYCRLGMLQFDMLSISHNSLSKQIFNKNLREEFEDKLAEAKALFGYDRNAYPGIFNTEFVGDDCRIAAHLQQIIRHERYLNRIATGEQTESSYTVDEYPADICQIADMEIPKFEMSIFNDTLKFKFNSGLGAIVCSKCGSVIKIGGEFNDEELKAIKGEIELPAQYCNKCEL